jgi:hypothetical protein
MDFNFITSENANLLFALQACVDLYKKEFEGTGTKMHSTQVLQSVRAAKMLGAPPELTYMVVVTIVNEKGIIVPLSKVVKNN